MTPDTTSPTMVISRAGLRPGRRARSPCQSRWLALTPDHLRAGTRHAHGPGIPRFLQGPIPWRSPPCRARPPAALARSALPMPRRRHRMSW
ncbi:hypothetical protein A176_003016 [Myxococcus hansupus]|uniref:Uncharacterized protein n=1 Tax=Pseudomyxococcus hansupus TaxID=1297742 RepID=A0A0H4WTI0_9BACT|nr:hypothetical protein A176_003016 [Myxococcus hansupus]